MRYVVERNLLFSSPAIDHGGGKAIPNRQSRFPAQSGFVIEKLFHSINPPLYQIPKAFLYGAHPVRGCTAAGRLTPTLPGHRPARLCF